MNRTKHPLTISLLFFLLLVISCNSNDTATPNLTGDNAGTPSPTSTITKVPTPVFSLSGGTYSSSQSVSISCSDATATIKYTTDGTDPSASNGTVYSIAIDVSSTTTIKAFAYKSGMTDSEIVSATYTINIWTPLTAGELNCSAGTVYDLLCSGDTSSSINHVDILDNPGTKCANTAGGHDDIWLYVPAITGTLNVRLSDGMPGEIGPPAASTEGLSVFVTSAEMDGLNYTYSDDLGTAGEYIDCGFWSLGSSPDFDVPVTGGAPYYIIVDAENGTEAGPYTLEIRLF